MPLTTEAAGLGRRGRDAVSVRSRRLPGQRAGALVDAALDRFLPPETRRPTTVHQAMRYSVFAGGKRLRPILVIAGAEAVGGRRERVPHRLRARADPHVLA